MARKSYTRRDEYSSRRSFYPVILGQSSDRRKFKQRVVTAFSVSPEDGDLLVPEGILTAKFSTHLDLPGVAYLSSDGDPLWITLGKGSDELIPTLYTLWKKHRLLPFICTPAAVIPILVGGADLMIREFIACRRTAGRLIKLKEGGKEKGKAALIIHTWKITYGTWDAKEILRNLLPSECRMQLYQRKMKNNPPSMSHNTAPPPSEPAAARNDIYTGRKPPTHKSFTAFLSGREGLAFWLPGSEKSTPQQNEAVRDKDLELKVTKKTQREEEEREREALAHHELSVRELWKPHLVTAELFKVMGASTSDLYSIPEIRTLLNNYITSKDIVNQHDRAYINLDNLLRSCVVAKAPSSKKGKEPEPPQQSHDFMRRDDLYRKVLERMQSWHEVRAEGKDPVVK
ncbi:hypothetical protein DFS33DRAFT_1416273 [Desarmillaria ectypa]|nr:hypothetical protein DFS33DRAFT_1416273 [Desarmillaria ectypa]